MEMMTLPMDRFDSATLALGKARSILKITLRDAEGAQGDIVDALHAVDDYLNEVSARLTPEERRRT